MKKHIALLLTLVLLGTMFLTACGNDTAVSQAPSGDPGASSTDAAPELSGEIVVATWAGDPYESAWKDKAAEFEEKTGVKVTIDAVPWENLREKCILELASQTGAYDVLYVHPSWFEEFVNNDYLVPVEEYATQEEIDAYVPNLVADYSRNGKAYGLPDFIATQVLAYRTDIFEEKNLKAPESWDELLEVCEALKGSDEYAPITFPGKKGGTLASVFSAFLVSNGGWYRNDAGEPNVNSTEAVETAEFLAKLAQYEPSGYLNVHWDENGKIAAGGKAAMAVIMTINSAWLEDAESSATAGKWAYVPIKSNDGTPGGIVDNYCWSVASDSQNKDAAGAFVKFITDTDAQIYFTEKSSTCGATNAYYENTELQKSQPVLVAMQETLTNTKPAPSWGTWAAEQEVLEVSLQDVMSGKLSAKDAMEQVQAKMTEE